MAIDPSISFKVLRPDQVDSLDRQARLQQADVNMIPLKQKEAEQTVQANDMKMQYEQLKQARDAADRKLQMLGSAVDQQTWTRVLQQAQAEGEDVSDEPQQFDPNYVKNLAMQGISMKDRLDMKLKEAESILKQGLLGAQIGTERAQAGAYGALANQRNTAASLNTANTERVRKMPVGVPTDKVPIGYRYKEDGTLEPIPGGPRDPNTQQAKPLTEAQSNAALYAQRMQESNKVIEDLGQAGYRPTLGQQAVSNLPAGNYLIGKDTQKFQQAQRDFINAVLRRESGAVISDQEFANAKQQYFPQPGDSEGVLVQKAANRQTAIQGIRNAAGAAMRTQVIAPSPSAFSDEDERRLQELEKKRGR